MLLKASLWADVISGGTVSLPPAQIDKPGQTQKIDITRDSGAAGKQRRGQFSVSPFNSRRVGPSECSSAMADCGTPVLHFSATLLIWQTPGTTSLCPRFKALVRIRTETVKRLINGRGLNACDLCPHYNRSAVQWQEHLVFTLFISSCYSSPPSQVSRPVI